MVSWSKKDQELLFTLVGVNGDSVNWHDVSIQLSGRYTSTESLRKYREREEKIWKRKDDKILWKSKNLIDLRLDEVSVRLRRPQHCVKTRFLELTEEYRNHRKFFRVIDEDNESDPKVKSNSTRLCQRDDEQSSKSLTRYEEGLLLASKIGDTELVVELLNRGVDVNTQDRDGISGLHYAALRGKLEIVKLLLTYGAQINISNKVACTPLQMATEQGNSQVCQFLIKKGAQF